jgi:hypothetical protein
MASPELLAYSYATICGQASISTLLYPCVAS